MYTLLSACTLCLHHSWAAQQVSRQLWWPADTQALLLRWQHAVQLPSNHAYLSFQLNTAPRASASSCPELVGGQADCSL
jgi:hypothetical protein